MAAELIMILVVDGRLFHVSSAFLESIRQLLVGCHLHVGKLPHRCRALWWVRRVLRRETHFGFGDFLDLVVSGLTGLLVLMIVIAVSLFFLEIISRGPVRIRQSIQQTRPIVWIPLSTVSVGVVIRRRGVAVKTVPVVSAISSVHRLLFVLLCPRGVYPSLPR